MSIKELLGNVMDALTGHHPRDEQENVLPASQDPYGDPADQENMPGGVLPASQDPYGDPADQHNGQNVLPASQDPYGDPADQYDGHNVRPASQDPYGDPADEEQQPAPAGNARRWPF